MPRESPVVPKAETASKATSANRKRPRSILADSVVASATMSPSSVVRVSRSSAIARATCAYGTSRLKTSGRGRPWIAARPTTTSTITVLILMPPATEPEAPPMNMSSM